VICFVRFWAFLGKGSSKTTLKYFCKKSMSKTFPSPCRKLFPKKSTKISMSGFPRLFLFYRPFRRSSAAGVQNYSKKRFAKNRVERFLQKNRQKIQNRCFLDFVLSRFWVFSMRGVQKHNKKNIENNKCHPGPFLASDPPTHHGSHRFFLVAAPCLGFRLKGHLKKKRGKVGRSLSRGSAILLPILLGVVLIPGR
jgi:hypothetical protein